VLPRRILTQGYVQLFYFFYLRARVLSEIDRPTGAGDFAPLIQAAVTTHAHASSLRFENAIATFTTLHQVANSSAFWASGSAFPTGDRSRYHR